MTKVMDEELAKRTLDFEQRPKQVRTYAINLSRQDFDECIHELEHLFEEEFSLEEQDSIYYCVRHLTVSQWIRLLKHSFTTLRTAYGLPTIFWFIAQADEVVRQQPQIHLPQELITDGRQGNFQATD